MLNHRTTALPNGLRFITVEQPHLHWASVSVLVRCGSRHERDEEWGLTHLVEHMLFRGTARHANGRDLARVFGRAGGTMDATTWRDHTSLEVAAHPDHLHQVLVALSDMARRPRFNNLETERAIVLEELRGELDERGRDIDISNLSRAAIWHQHRLGRRITGSFDTLSAITTDDVVRHHREHYTGANIVVSVAGKLDADRLHALAGDVFGALEGGTVTDDGPAACFSPPRRVDVYERDGSQLEIQITFDALEDPHPDFHNLALVTRILDDGFDGKLEQALCESAGLVYHLHTGLDCYADGGLFDIEMSVAPERAAAAVESTLLVLERLCQDGVSEDDLDFVRQRSRYELEFLIDSPAEVSAFHSAAALFGRPTTLEDTARRFETSRTADLSRVARRVFGAGRLHVTVLGPAACADMKRIEAAVETFSRGGG